MLIINVDMCLCSSFMIMPLLDGFVVLLLGNLFVEGCYIDGVRACFMEALVVCRCAVDTSVWAKGFIVNIKALFYAFGGAHCAFVLLLGCCFGGNMCKGLFGFLFLGT